MPLPEPLRATLLMVAEAMAPARQPWWIVSSAAVALHGADPGQIGDVDVLFDPSDAPPLLKALGLSAEPGQGSDQFRSAVFARWTDPPLPVEFFADFHLHEAGEWRPVLLVTRDFVAVDGAALPVPSREELRALLQRFGRAKDHARAAALSASGRFPSRSGSV